MAFPPLRVGCLNHGAFFFSAFRFLELKACCCGGADQSGGGDDASQVGFTFAAWEKCRDSKFPLHRRTRACAALAELPPSIPLDSTA